MKLAVAIAPENALASAFVVFRGLEMNIPKAAEMGYDGIELALRDKDQVDIGKVKKLVNRFGMEIPVVSTGQVFAGLNLWFTSPDASVRQKAVEVFRGLAEVAAEFGAMINMGRVRGFIAEGESVETAERRFGEVAGQIGEYAYRLGVRMILEPVNRYEINFINNLDEGVALLRKLNIPGMKLMPDVFHMNIEDVSIEGNLQKYIDDIAYIHFADSNRLAPGWGHLDFGSIVNALNEVRYQGWASVEILPKPDPDSAARQAADYLRRLIPKGK